MSLLKAAALFDLYRRGAIPTLAEHEVHPDVDQGSRENYLYFTLPVCINFQRNSPAMWQAALATFSDPQTNYLYYPEKLAVTAIEQIRADLLKHKLALQPNKHTHIWTTIAGSLHRLYNDDPRQMIQESDNRVRTLIDTLQGPRRPDFPYLSGPKLANYWPYILSQYTDVKFVDMHEISIIPDTHIIQSSIKLGLVPPGANQAQVEWAWKNLLKGSDISPVQMHPVLWNWSRNNFQPEV